MNLEDLVRDALDDLAHDPVVPNERDLLLRLAHRDRVARSRRVAVACGGFVVAILVAVLAAGSARGDMVHRHLDVTNTSRFPSYALTPTTRVPAPPTSVRRVVPPAPERHVVATPTTAAAQPLEPVAAPPTTVGSAPVIVPVPPTEATTSTSASTTTSTTEPSLTWDITSHSDGGSSMWVEGTGLAGSGEISTNTPYLDTRMNDGVFPIFWNGVWGGGVGFTASPGQTIDVTFTCTCGGSRTVTFTAS